MPFPPYVKLVCIVSQSSYPEHIACHFFFLFDWNIVSCAKNIVNSHMDLFHVYDDALQEYCGPSKGDQIWTKQIDHPCHVYTVPKHPEICPALTFSKNDMSYQGSKWCVKFLMDLVSMNK